jgi:hypothetical protein
MPLQMDTFPEKEGNAEMVDKDLTPHPEIGSLELAIEASSERYDELDERWLGQVQDLWSSLRHDVGGVQNVPTPVSGSKGILESLRLIIDSASAVTAAIHLLTGWLERDTSRSLKIAWSAGGRRETLVLKGDALDPTAMRDVASVLIRRLSADP